MHCLASYLDLLVFLNARRLISCPQRMSANMSDANLFGMLGKTYKVGVPQLWVGLQTPLRISIDIYLLSIDVPFKSKNNYPQSFCGSGSFMGYTLGKFFGCCFLKERFNKASIFLGKLCMFKALTWIWFSKVNGPALPKERCIKVDKVPLEKKWIWEKTSHNRGPPPPFTRYSIIFENCRRVPGH